MKTQTFIIGCALALALLLFAQQRRPEGVQATGFHSIVDLTHAVNGSNPTYGADEAAEYRVASDATYEKDKYFARKISLPEHFGTHIDAPAHFARGLWTVDQIPPERLIAPVVVLDLTAKAESNADYQLSVEDIADWEKAHGPIPQNSVVMLMTGWESRWHSAQESRNADRNGVMHFPGYSLEAARFLVEARGVMGFGIDTLSVDYGPAPDFAVHQYTMAHSVYHLENVANLAKIPATGAMVIVAPMKLEGGSGGPVRILALLH